MDDRENEAIEVEQSRGILAGQTAMNLHPIKRVLKLAAFILLAAVLVFLTIKMIGKPDGASLRDLSDGEQEQEQEENRGILPGETGLTEEIPETVNLSALLLEPAMQVFLPAPASPVFQLRLPDPADRVPQQSVTLLAVGDNLMHNTVVWSGQTAYGYDFRPLYSYIKDDVQAVDIACINQETIFVNDPNQFTNYPSFGGPVQIGEALIDTGFNVIEHATNHCYDKFDTGIHDTLAFWSQHPEITVLGIHDSQADADTIRVVEVNGIRIAMLNYTYGTNAGYPSASYMVDYLGDKDQIAQDIAEAKNYSDFVIVFPHWGTENTFRPDENQREWAQFFADQGVGAVIGSHTHTLQPLEIYTRPDGSQMPVYWSLGNFVSHMSQPQNMLGGMALMTISRDDYGVYVSSCTLEPTVTYGTHDFGVWQFYGMKLSDYTDEMAAHHLIEGTSVRELEALYQYIISDD